MSSVGKKIHTFLETLSLMNGRAHRPLVVLDSRLIDLVDVVRLHLVYGFPALDLGTGEQFVRSGTAPKRFRPDLPAAARRRIIERTIRECEHCRQDPEAAYLANVWNAWLSVLQLRNTGSAPMSVSSMDARMCENSGIDSTTRIYRICHDVWPLFCLAQFLELSPVEVLDCSAEECSALLHILRRDRESLEADL